jgi:hypothetical protein
MIIFFKELLISKHMLKDLHGSLTQINQAASLARDTRKS